MCPDFVTVRQAPWGETAETGWPWPQPPPERRLAWGTARHGTVPDATLHAACAAVGVVLPERLVVAAPWRQAEYLCGRLAAARAVHRLRPPDNAAGVPAQSEPPIRTGISTAPSPQPISPQPMLARAPTWPAGLCGALTHHGGLGMALVGLHSDWIGLGLDVERVLPAVRASRLARHLLQHPDEQVQWRDSAHQELWLTLAFSARESLYKAISVPAGRHFGLRDARVLALSGIATGSPPQAGTITLALTTALGPGWPVGSTFSGPWGVWENQVCTGILVPRTG